MVVQDLSEVVSHEMGPREQLDVKRIISDDVTICATDTEFVIGQTCSKFQILVQLFFF